MCFERWSLRANFFSHTGHWYGLTPEWDRRCRDNSSDRENLKGRIRDVFHLAKTMRRKSESGVDSRHVTWQSLTRVTNLMTLDST